jgi:hypothetical protein
MLLPVAMIEAALWTPLVPAIGRTPLFQPGLVTTREAAVALSAVTMRAEKERRAAALAQTNPLPENRFPMRCHAYPQGGARQRQSFRGTLKPA